MDHANARNAKNGTKVEKKQLLEDLYYKRKQTNYKLYLFYSETTCK